MCEPVTITTAATYAAVAIAAASAATSYVSQEKSAAAQTRNAQEAYDSEVVQTKNTQVEATQASATAQSERARQAMVETAHLQALANESGTAGGSNDRVTNEANFNAGTDLATMQANAASSQRQLVNQLNGGYATAEQRMSNIQQPSLIGAGLQIAGAATSAYASRANANARASGSVPQYQSTQ